MTINLEPDTAKHTVFYRDVGQQSAPPYEHGSDYSYPSAAQRVLSPTILAHILQNNQHHLKVVGASMNRESVPTDPAMVAQSVLATWNRVDEALSPIIGQRGVAGLYKRSLALTRGAHPTLTAVFEGELTPGNYSTLQQTLAQQSGPVALAASAALLQTFNELLNKLIGKSLTERLLQPLLDSPSSRGDDALETSQ